MVERGVHAMKWLRADAARKKHEMNSRKAASGNCRKAKRFGD